MAAKDTFFSKKHTINSKGKLIDISQPCVMAIINVTPDSFYENSRFPNELQVLEIVEEHISQGATFIDIGAYSSRPGAENISEIDEINRLKPILKAVSKNFPETLFSLDTFRSKIAEWAVNEYGIDLINDISGGTLDPQMFATIAKLNVPYVLMHMRGTPNTMQNQTNYTNTVKNIMVELSAKVAELNKIGVNDIIIDPGFGFAKNVEQNFELLNKLDIFKIFELPILVGLSRKSMIYKPLEITAMESLNGTSVLNTLALLNGASILRVHDTKEAMEAIKLVNLFRQTEA
jgi:dihydropteroate synthase